MVEFREPNDAVKRVFLDANIIFSASSARGATRRLFDSLANQGVHLISNSHALEEAKRNVTAKWPERLSELERLKGFLLITNAFFHGLTVDLSLEDVPILAGAIGARCDFLWTIDKRHFGKFFGTEIHGVTIVSGVALADAFQI